jgi:hypothetical protein
MSSGPSDKSRGTALALALVLGVFGGHRFYVGKTGTGMLMAATLGGCGLWYLYDLILVTSGGFRDADGHLVSEWDPSNADAPALPGEVLDELQQLRHEVAELADRLDFAERLLSAPRETGTAAERRPS